MLRYGNGVRCRGDPGALLQDIAALLPTPNLQLRVVMSPVVRPCPLPKTPRSQVSSSDLSCHPLPFPAPSAEVNLRPTARSTFVHAANSEFRQRKNVSIVRYARRSAFHSL